MKQKRAWYKLDNAGKLYPSITSTRVSTVFRISASLYNPVDPEILQKALNNIIGRFPYFKVNLKRGFFWYYFEYTEKYPQVQKETYYPCMFMLYKNKNSFPFRVLYFNNRISVEFSHSITDGMGGIHFLKSLLIEYFRLLGIQPEFQEKISKEEAEDAFKRYYVKNIPKPAKLKKAFHFPFKLNAKGEYYIITGIIPVNMLLEEAKKYSASLTQFLLALYFDTIQEFIRLHPCKLLPVVINLPVNLRNIFPSKTMRNFFISLTPQIDFRLGSYSFEEIINYIRNYMAIALNKKHISQHIHLNVKREKTIFIRLIPLFLKNLMMPALYNKFAERNYTTGLSNLGLITLPKSIENLVERFEVYPPPSMGNIIKVTTISYKDKIYISFGSLTKNTEIEKIFFRKIRKMNIPVKIETNRE
ncbi:MAG: hypothetical protein GX198_07815 [Epulopiscium sp.]|nr:hypothetical protein [Candidatus Epulonipiscium sp.]HOQ16195.1 hypothetical protein [Defluviitaleaceae bacterium]HPT75183.1 hypothetical protein [Defluviitaleaceae bacterium]